jgi:hypothetical protein
MYVRRTRAFDFRPWQGLPGLSGFNAWLADNRLLQLVSLCGGSNELHVVHG